MVCATCWSVGFHGRGLSSWDPQRGPTPPGPRLGCLLCPPASCPGHGWMLQTTMVQMSLAWAITPSQQLLPGHRPHGDKGGWPRSIWWPRLAGHGCHISVAGWPREMGRLQHSTVAVAMERAQSRDPGRLGVAKGHSAGATPVSQPCFPRGPWAPRNLTYHRIQNQFPLIIYQRACTSIIALHVKPCS